jgi:predicted ATPase
LTDENASIVADICRRLDGIPLALELASSRIKMLSPGQLRGRLEERFRVLTGGSRDAPSRQRTLRALFDWSHDLLDQRERVLLRHLGIFVNGFTLDAAEAVASGADLDEREVLDVLASLVDNSLVLAEPHGNSLRYRLLESTRAYALEKLADAGERDLVAGRHLRYLRDRFAQLFEEYEQTVRRTDLISALQTDLEDIRSALDGALARSEIIDGGALLTNIYTCWQDIGLATEGNAWCERYLAALPAQELRLRARLLTELSYLLLWSGHQLRAFELAEEAVELGRASGDWSSLEWALRIYSFTATRLNRLDDAERALTQAEAVPAVSANDRHGLLAARAYYSQASGDYDTAANLNEQIRKECRALGNVLFQNLATHNLAEVEHKRGQTRRAIALVREMLLTVRSAPHTSMFSAVSLHVNLAGYLDVLPRQQTLRALIDWSHDLLDERERSLFRRHSVFVNGSTLEGVVAVAGGADLDELEVFDLLGSLVDKSLVLAEPDGDALRYRMLESTRAYAAEKLADAGESDELARRHLRYLRDRFAALWAQSERSGRPDEVVKTLAAELEDVRFALESARTRSDVIAGSELLAGIGGNWLNLALGAEGAARNASYLSALPAGQSRLRAVLSTNASFLSLHAGQTARAFDTATQALAHARESGEPQTLAEALLIRGTTAGRLGMFDVADAALSEAQAIPETSAYFRLRLFVDRATLSAIRGDSKTAATMLEQARERSRALGNTRLELRSAINLAETEHAQGNTARATGIVRECLPALRSGAYQLELATTLRNLTGYLLAVDDHPAALAVGREAVELYAEMDPDHARIAFAVEHIALVAALRGDLARAATLEGYAEAAIRRHGGEREPTETKTFNRLGALLRDGLDREEFKRQIAAGAALAPEAATALALSLALALAKS